MSLAGRFDKQTFDWWDHWEFGLAHLFVKQHRLYALHSISNLYDF